MYIYYTARIHESTEILTKIYFILQLFSGLVRLLLWLNKTITTTLIYIYRFIIILSAIDVVRLNIILIIDTNKY